MSLRSYDVRLIPYNGDLWPHLIQALRLVEYNLLRRRNTFKWFVLAIDLAHTWSVLLRSIITPFVRLLVLELYASQVFVEKLLVASNNRRVSLLQVYRFLVHWVFYRVIQFCIQSASFFFLRALVFLLFIWLLIGGAAYLLIYLLKCGPLWTWVRQGCCFDWSTRNRVSSWASFFFSIDRLKKSLFQVASRFSLDGLSIDFLLLVLFD